MRLLVFLAQYDQERYANAFSCLMQSLEALELDGDYGVIVIDNKEEGHWIQQQESNVWRIGGDNSVFEFSAWMKGLSAVKEKQLDAPMLLFVTDAFLVYGDDYTALLSPKLLPFLESQQAVAGLVDEAPSQYKAFQWQQWTFREWVRSSFFLIPTPVLESMGSLITCSTIKGLCYSEFHHPPFLPEAPLNIEYQRYLEEWLTQKWHSAFSLSPETWDRFCQKLRSILNEHALTARWKEQNIPIYDLNFLKKISHQLHCPLPQLSRPQLQAYTHDLAWQKHYCRPHLDNVSSKKSNNASFLKLEGMSWHNVFKLHGRIKKPNSFKKPFSQEPYSHFLLKPLMVLGGMPSWSL